MIATWRVEETPARFRVVDPSGKSLAHVYGEDDEARRVALAIAGYPSHCLEHCSIFGVFFFYSRAISLTKFK